MRLAALATFAPKPVMNRMAVQSHPRDGIEFSTHSAECAHESETRRNPE
jgi:hypothetical protein